MSAIAKPHVVFGTALGAQATDMIPVEDILSASKLDIPAFLSNKASSQITVVLKGNNPGHIRNVRFATPAARDAAFTALGALAAAAV
jgi:hypothetical protein